MNKQTKELREKFVEILYESDIDAGRIEVELVKAGTARENYYPLADELLQACKDK